MASLPEVDAAVRVLIDRLHAVDERTRERHAVERTVSCLVTDLDVVYSARYEDGAVGALSTDPQPPAQVRLAVASDDLLELVAGRLSLPVAWATGRLRVDASVLDLLKIRMML